MLRDSGSGVPRTVQDLVLARTAGLPSAARSIVELVSVVPGQIERWLVDRVLDAGADGCRCVHRVRPADRARQRR
jgi:hypothetical protein